MGIAPEQRERRRHWIGASDSALIMGCSPWGSAYDLWLEKTGRVTRDLEEMNEGMENGNRLEDTLVSWAAENIGLPVRRNVECPPAEGSAMGANFDGLVDGAPIGIEAKYSRFADDWGAAGSDEIPIQYIIQCQHQMHVAHLDIIHVPAFVDYSFRLYYVRRDDELCEEIVRQCEAFWECVRSDTPPSNCLPSLRSAELWERNSDVVMEVPDDVAAAWIEERNARLARKKVEEKLRIRILTAMMGSRVARCSLGTFTYKGTTPTLRFTPDTTTRSIEDD